GIVHREDVTELGEVCAGLAQGRGSDDEVTLFDSTGLAIQDLAIAIAAHAALAEGRVEAQTVTL
ncbi:MAG: ornithine cyclodeaminase family protein, partial [Solirubrobacteraceae bacterium]